MVEISYPFATAPGNTMTENQWAQMFRYVLGTGVISVSFQDELNQLLVEPGATPLTVDIDTGSAWIQGHYYQSDAVNTLTITQNTSASIRADLIVLECKWGLDAGITAKVVTGIPGAVWPITSSRAGTPMPPTPVQTYEVKWQLPIAQVNTAQNKAVVYVASDIIDWRAFVNSGSAKSSTYVVASDGASALIRANADAVIPYGSINAEEVINEAISTVSGYGGGTVLLSEGTHNTSDSINPLSNVAVKGLGTKTVIQYNVSGATNNNPVINCDAVDNVTISDLTIDGGSGADLVDVSPPTEVVGYNGITVADGTYVVIRNAVVKHCKARGIAVTSSDSDLTTSFGHRVEGCYVGDNYSYGIYLQANGVLVTNNQVNHNTYGIYLYSVTGNYGANGNIISNNNVRLSLKHGITLDAATASGTGGVTYNNISNNIIANSSRSLNDTYSDISMTGAKCMYNMVQGNHCQGWTAVPGPLRALIVDANIAYNFITGNYFYNVNTKVTQATEVSGSPAATNRVKYNFVLPSVTPAACFHDSTGFGIYD